MTEADVREKDFGRLKNSFTARVVIHSSSNECYYEGVWCILRKCHEQEAEHVVKVAVAMVGRHQK